MPGHVKGAALREFVAWLGKHDPERSQAIVERIPEAQRIAGFG